MKRFILSLLVLCTLPTFAQFTDLNEANTFVDRIATGMTQRAAQIGNMSEKVLPGTPYNSDFFKSVYSGHSHVIDQVTATSEALYDCAVYNLEVLETTKINMATNANNLSNLTKAAIPSNPYCLKPIPSTIPQLGAYLNSLSAYNVSFIDSLFTEYKFQWAAIGDSYTYSPFSGYINDAKSFDELLQSYTHYSGDLIKRYNDFETSFVNYVHTEIPTTTDSDYSVYLFNRLKNYISEIKINSDCKDTQISNLNFTVARYVKADSIVGAVLKSTFNVKPASPVENSINLKTYVEALASRKSWLENKFYELNSKLDRQTQLFDALTAAVDVSYDMLYPNDEYKSYKLPRERAVYVSDALKKMMANEKVLNDSIASLNKKHQLDSLVVRALESRIETYYKPTIAELEEKNADLTNKNIDLGKHNAALAQMAHDQKLKIERLEAENEALRQALATSMPRVISESESIPDVIYNLQGIQVSSLDDIPDNSFYILAGKVCFKR